MSSADNLVVAQNLLTTLLSLQNTVSKPSEEICRQILSIQGLAEFSGKAASGGDWRRGVYSPQQPQQQQPSNQQQSLSRWRNSSSAPSLHIKSVASNNSLDSFATSTSTPGPTHTPGPIRYHSKFRNSHQPVEDKILNNIILSKLNKFSEATYPEVREFLYQILGSGEEDLREFVRDFMRLVFRKAAAEEIFCPLYARLLTEISSKYSVILEEMNGLSDRYLEIFEEVVEDNSTNYDAFVQKNIEKKYRLGYSQFLAELVKQEILSLTVLETTFTKLIQMLQRHSQAEDKKNLIEEYTDCLLRMSRVLKGRSTKFSRAAREVLLPPFDTFYQELLNKKENYISCSSKSRYILMDIHDILKGK